MQSGGVLQSRRMNESWVPGGVLSLPAQALVWRHLVAAVYPALSIKDSSPGTFAGTSKTDPWRATVHGGHKESNTTERLSVHAHTASSEEATFYSKPVSST